MSDLICFMREWLAKVCQLEENVFPIITKAYRLDSSNKLDRKIPRYIIVSFAGIKVKKRIQSTAREKNYL